MGECAICTRPFGDGSGDATEICCRQCGRHVCATCQKDEVCTWCQPTPSLPDDEFTAIEQAADDLSDEQLLDWLTKCGGSLLQDEHGNWRVVYDLSDVGMTLRGKFEFASHQRCVCPRDAIRCAWMEEQDGTGGGQ